MTGPSPVRIVTSAMAADSDALMRRHLRRNVLALGSDLTLYMVGAAFASQATIIPAFAAHLGAPNLVIGAIPAVITLGWLLPGLFAAGHTETLAAKLPFVVRYTIWERVPYLAMALVAFFVAARAPGAALGLLLLCLLAMSGVSGALMPAWMDIIGHAVPQGIRGRFFAASNAVANVGGLGVSFLAAAILAAWPAPQSYGVCFVGASVFMALSLIALLLTREIPSGEPAAPATPLSVYLARIPSLLRRDRNMAWFLAARAAGVVGVMSTGFFTVYALRTFSAPAWYAGFFTTMLLLGQVVGNLALGWLADRAGNRVVLVVGTAGIVGANLVALAAPSIELFNLVFVLDGLYEAAMLTSGLNVLLELAPAPAERPTYVGLGRTAVAPVAFAAPLVAGLVADAVGFAALFAASAAFSALSLGLFAARFRDPRALARARGVASG